MYTFIHVPHKHPGLASQHVIQICHVRWCGPLRGRVRCAVGGCRRIRRRVPPWTQERLRGGSAGARRHGVERGRRRAVPGGAAAAGRRDEVRPLRLLLLLLLLWVLLLLLLLLLMWPRPWLMHIFRKRVCSLSCACVCDCVCAREYAYAEYVLAHIFALTAAMRTRAGTGGRCCRASAPAHVISRSHTRRTWRPRGRPSSWRRRCRCGARALAVGAGRGWMCGTV
jgi:hypothetical protein